MASPGRVFLLSPARAGGPRYKMLVREQAGFDLAVNLRQGSATIGEVYAFISGLYFRGKLAYTEAFRASPPGIPPALVIVPGAGLVPPDTPVDIEQMRAIAEVPVDEDNPAYRNVLVRAASLIDQHAGPACHYVLARAVSRARNIPRHSLKSSESVSCFPLDFVGRGDMSRGGLMLRCASSGAELTYTPVLGAVRHGVRPPKLERWRKQ